MRAVEAHEELLFHCLAWMNVGAHHASLYDARYVRFARERYGDPCCAALDEDAALLSRRFRESECVQIHGFPVAFSGVDAIVACAKAGLREADDACFVHRGFVRSALACDEALAEILVADAALCARAFEATWSERVRPLIDDAIESARPFFERAAALDRTLRLEDLRFSSVLGMRGRGLDTLIFVGAPLAWNGEDPAFCAVQALHERAVMAADGAYVSREWSALCALSLRVAGSALEEAHARWLARLSLRGLLSQLVDEGRLSKTDAERIDVAGLRRAEILRVVTG